MNKILFLCILYLIFPLSKICDAKVISPPIKACILEPEYIGPLDFKGLSKDIRDSIIRKLAGKGIEAIPIEDSSKSDESDVAKACANQGAQFLVAGSLIVMGKAMSINLDAMWLGPGKKKKQLLSKEGTIADQSPLVTHLVDILADELTQPLKVAKLRVVGNRRADTDAILQKSLIKEDDMYDPVKIRDSIKQIFKMGFFDDIRVDVEDSPDGKIITYIVREKPSIRKIIFKGNKVIKDDKLKEAIDLKRYDIINDKKLVENAQKIEALYAEKGYLGTKVTPSYVQVSQEAADVTFDIFEGEKVLIKEIKIVGNKAFSDDELKALMETKEKQPIWKPSISNWLSLLKGDAAVLKWDALDRDRGRISAYYHNQGYIDARVGKPKVERRGKWIYITIPVEEGEVYKIGKVDVAQDYFKDKTLLLSKIQTKPGEKFNQETLRQDIIKLNDIFADEGFAYADTTPDIKKHRDKKIVDITFRVATGPKVHFERIEIVGNTRTRDKVIRRELRVNELEPFSASGLRKSRQRLGRLGYFEDINLTPERGSSDDTMRLRVKVKERPTGTFSIGAGYSSVDKLILMGEISQRNFLGKGQTLSFKGLLGSTTNRYSLSFVEPYLRDTRLSFGFDLYNWNRQYDDYTKDSSGGAVRLGYPLSDNLNIYWGLRIDNTTLSDLSVFSSQIIRESLDIHTTRAISLGLRYDTRNDYYLPTIGWNNSINTEYAGGVLGGDSAYIKVEGTLSYYHQLWKSLVGHIRVGSGYITQGTGGKLPVYERFFLGGIDSIRGYKYGRVSPIDPATGERVGGEFMAYAQTEGIFPLIRDMGLHGVVFFDTGNVWENFSNAGFGDVRYSVGFGVRWLSPMGPLRIEWGYNLNTKVGEEKSNWEFRMGGSF
ncbi:Outer membrane protein assembly factor YaeT precursor [Dissulfuribacter thermophilus]|uniref:Outer membrane protein assembly factor BamA n=1 Tax=Dissulfuribacter thermophilus TaxID=1156395 RepID=A0A1B9F4N3_9BACT|nr:outer membrane protein assembly factor BamA [Dissulfuribacter thermophilus]OCC14909.1 Outer membrane protein assembly factor YaeT precursor [Dissulfuribacter thermophilus]